MSKPKISEIIEVIESRIPTRASESYDNVGLIGGDASQVFQGAMIGGDLTESLLKEAVKKKANLIIIHHPPFFPRGKGLNRLVKGKSNELSTLMLEAYEKKICVYVAHTNFDRCAIDGMVQLALDLGGEPVARLWKAPSDGGSLLKKLVTYVPMPQFDEVRDALYEVGCGHIGNYDSCGFATPGLGTFRPLKNADPTIGKKADASGVGELEEVEEIRLETLFPDGMQDVVLETLKYVHPYEEVAYDIYSVDQLPAMKGIVWGLGYGFVADLDKPVSYEVFAKRVKKVFGVKNFTTNQVTPKTVKRIAFSPGSGGSLVSSARANRVDVFITGEVGYHGSLDAARRNLNVIELGHRESEHYFLKTFHSWFTEWELKCSVLDERTQRVL